MISTQLDLFSLIIRGTARLGDSPPTALYSDSKVTLFLDLLSDNFLADILNKSIAQAGGSVINDTLESVYNIAVHCAWGDDDAIDRVFTQIADVMDKVLDAESLSKLRDMRDRL